MTTLAERRQRVRRQHRRAGAVGLLVLAGVVLLLASRVVYNEWPWSTYPSTLRYCDREYQPSGGQVTQAQLDPGSHRVGDVSGWLNSGEVWGTTGCGADVPTTVAVRGDGGRYQRYSLEGGP